MPKTVEERLKFMSRVETAVARLDARLRRCSPPLTVHPRARVTVGLWLVTGKTELDDEWKAENDGPET